MFISAHFRVAAISTLALLLSACITARAPQHVLSGGDWPAYGGDAGGSKYSPLREISRDNVRELEVAWTYRTGEADSSFATAKETSFEATPIVIDGAMYIGTPLGRVIALDAATGAERWIFDSKVDRNLVFGDFANRGVSSWVDADAAPGATCRRRIYIATIDARLFALDALDGRPCMDFGREGMVDLRKGLRNPPYDIEEYEQTSPPAVVNGVVIVGSAIADNNRVDAASGEVRGFDARTGALKWTWDPVPQSAADPAFVTWQGQPVERAGGANAWTILTADPARDLVFVPTGSPSPDYFGGLRRGENLYANSVVALRASTGEVVWHFQTVHHDLWDYDNASPAALADLRRDGRIIPAVLQANKSGMLFVLHRETGEPVFPVKEQPVPSSTVPEEEAWPTQPFTTGIPPLSPHRFSAEEAWGATPEDRAACREMIAPLTNEGIFTPPSLEGTLVVPSNVGGAHWGGVAVDEHRQVAIVPVNRVATMVQLIPDASFDPVEARAQSERYGDEYTRMRGTPYVMRRRILRAPSGLPCTPPPFGSLVAVSLETGEILWDVPLGSLRALAGEEVPAEWGSINLGGAVITAGGVVFMAGTLDRRLHAFDEETGTLLWSGELPASARATPMTYQVGGRQYVAVAAGGGGVFGKGDTVVVFARK